MLNVHTLPSDTNVIVLDEIRELIDVVAEMPYAEDEVTKILTQMNISDKAVVAICARGHVKRYKDAMATFE